MDIIDQIPSLSTQTQLHLTWAVIAFKYLAEFYSSIKNGGGLKRIAMSFWFGENLPVVVAQDYKKELSTTSEVEVKKVP